MLIRNYRYFTSILGGVAPRKGPAGPAGAQVNRRNLGYLAKFALGYDKVAFGEPRRAFSWPSHENLLWQRPVIPFRYDARPFVWNWKYGAVH